MLIVAFDKSTMYKAGVCERSKSFKHVREDVEEDDRPGRLSKSTTNCKVEQVKKLTMDNH